MLSIKLRGFFYTIGVALALSSATCTASSSVGRAVITDVNGLPCFGVPNNAETRDGVPLFTVIVTKRNLPGATTLPEKVWFSWIEPRGKSILLKPGSCIRYGVLPPSAQQEFLVPLEPYSIYSLMLQAFPQNSSLRGYKGEFCMIPGAGNKLRVQVVPWDEKASTWRYDLCNQSAK